MNPIRIEYRFKLDDSRNETFEIALDEASVEVLDRSPTNAPAWTRLEFHKCHHCPLKAADHPHCPAALSLVEVVDRCGDIVSYDQVELEVAINEKQVCQTTSAQRGLSALLGLLMSTSGCPHLDFFKPMARLHLPFATQQDTVFRAAGMYLLAQYFLGQAGKKTDYSLRGLKEIYCNLHDVNIYIARRLRGATQTDSSVNAVSLLDIFSTVIPLIIDDNLEDIRQWFNPYLSELFQEIVAKVETDN